MDILEPINIHHKLLFGTEIEFYGINIWELAKLINNDINLEFVLDHKFKKVDFSKWYLDTDSSIRDSDGVTILGGEVSSKIMTNVMRDYEELVSICNFLKNNGASINEYCSNHVHVSINEDYDLNYFLEVFSKVIAVYESELIHFFKGETSRIRKTFFEYSRCLNPMLLSKLENLIFDADNIFYRLLYGGKGIFMLRDAINLQNYKMDKQIEFRYPNGSLNPNIIKNNIRLCLLIIDAILDYRFDVQDLNEKIKFLNHDEDAINRGLLLINKLEDFEELVDIIAPTNNDKKLLLSQYNQVVA